MIFSLIIGFLLGAAAIIFAFQNTAVVALTFLNWQFQSSLALMVIIALLVGALVSMLLSLPSAIRDRFHMHGLRKENKKLATALNDVVQQQATVTTTTVVTEESTPTNS